jgi:hypothetical protein
MNLPSERGMRMPSSPNTIVLMHGFWVTEELGALEGADTHGSETPVEQDLGERTSRRE